MNNWYDEYKAKIAAESKNLKDNKEISQHVLWLKAYASEKLDGKKEGCKTFQAQKNGEMLFGFSEALVNELMQYAFDAGARDIDKKSYELGRDQMWQEVLKKLDIDLPEDNY